MAIDLNGRAAIVTGARGGIGAALVRRAVAEGMIVHAWDRLPIAGGTLPARVHARQIDVTDADAVRRAAGEVFAQGAEVALVCANAGILRTGRSWEIAVEDWRRVVEVNILGIVNLLSACVPKLIAQQGRSHLLLTGSQSSFVARPGNAAYASSKHAVWCIAESLRLELMEARAPVGVSLLAPGPVRTGLAHGLGAFDDALQQIGMAPDDVAATAFEAIARDRFWVLTHDGITRELEQRIANLLAGRNPG